MALKKALITMVILALLAALAACNYIALRYFGIIPGYGVQTDPNASQYVLSDVETIQSDHFRINVTDAWLRDDTLDIRILFEWTDPNTDVHVILKDDYSRSWFEDAQLGDGISGKLYYGSNDWDWESGKFTVTYVLYDPQLIQDEEGLVCVILFDGAQIRFRLSEAQTQTPEQTGYSVVTENGGFYALPRIEDGHLYVQIYPLDPENYTIDPMLTSHYMKYQFGLSGDVTATAEDGTVRTGSIVKDPEQISTDFYEWDFGEAEPGEYTLHIPFVFVSRDLTEYMKENIWTPLSLTDGEAVSITVPGGTVTFGTVQTLEQTEEGLYRWWVPRETEISNAYQLLSVKFIFMADNAQPLPENTLLSTNEVVSQDGTVGIECTCAVALSGFQVKLYDISFLWECDMTIPLRAEE